MNARAHVVALALLAAGCASHAPSLAVAPALGLTRHGYAVGNSEALVARPVMPALWRYRVVNIDDAAFKIDERTAAPCYREKSALPERGPIRDRTYVLARNRDGNIIDLCADRFNVLRATTFRIIGALRDW